MKKQEIREKLDEKTVVSVKNVAKTFRLPKEHSSELKQTVINWIKRQRGYTDLNVLRDISFDVKKGDFFGIVGRNGSGKSTLLKLLAGIYQPTKGNIKTKGKIVPFIELGVGFNPELTGRENVYMNGAMLGFSNSEVDEMYDEIVDFAELPDFMDQKLKNYSSGMQVRLAFSIAIKAQGDILILDEVLAVGDEAFQRKCDDFFAKIRKDKSKTVILVTHSMDAVKRYCNKAILITDGEIQKHGNPDDVANEYSLENSERILIQDDEKISTEKTSVKNLTVQILSGKTLTENDKLRFRITYETENDVDSYVAFSVVDMEQRWIYNENSLDQPCSGKGKHVLDYEADLSMINDNILRLMVSVRSMDDSPIAFTKFEKSPIFSISRKDIKTKSQRDAASGLIHQNGKWKISREKK